jgi:hypothetical protein
VQALELPVDGGARLVQPPPHIGCRAARMLCQVVNDLQPDRWHGVTGATDRQLERLPPVDAYGDSTTNNLGELLRELVGISGAWQSMTSPR